jgi:hypothetical protein
VYGTEKPPLQPTESTPKQTSTKSKNSATTLLRRRSPAPSRQNAGIRLAAAQGK